MEEALIALWHKLRDAMKHIEDKLGFVPGEGGVHTESGDNGPPPPPPKKV